MSVRIEAGGHRIVIESPATAVPTTTTSLETSTLVASLSTPLLTSYGNQTSTALSAATTALTSTASQGYPSSLPPALSAAHTAVHSRADAAAELASARATADIASASLAASAPIASSLSTAMDVLSSAHASANAAHSSAQAAVLAARDAKARAGAVVADKRARLAALEAEKASLVEALRAVLEEQAGVEAEIEAALGEEEVADACLARAVETAGDAGAAVVELEGRAAEVDAQLGAVRAGRLEAGRVRGEATAEAGRLVRKIAVLDKDVAAANATLAAAAPQAGLINALHSVPGMSASARAEGAPEPAGLGYNTNVNAQTRYRGGAYTNTTRKGFESTYQSDYVARGDRCVNATYRA